MPQWFQASKVVSSSDGHFGRFWERQSYSNCPALNAYPPWGIRLRRDSWVSVRYPEGLNAAKSSVPLQRADRQGMLGQKPADLPGSV